MNQEPRKTSAAKKTQDTQEFDTNFTNLREYGDGPPRVTGINTMVTELSSDPSASVHVVMVDSIETSAVAALNRNKKKVK